MRNLKKVLAVVLTIALLASMMMVPALAAVSNEDEAKALKAIGLFKGFSETDLGLESNLTREQGIILVIRAMGAEQAALAMTDAEVNAALANVTDVNTIGTWAGAENYAAYALSKEITLGVSAEKLVYGGQLDFAADQLVILLLRAMGYEDVTKENCWDIAIAAEFVSAGEAVALDMNNAINRDLAAGVLFTAVKDGVCKDGELLINKLIAAGAVSEAAAVKGGFIAAKPDVLEVESVEATNLIEVVVTFNNDVNEDTVDESDFDVDGDAPDSVSVDGNVVTLTMKDADVLENDEEYTLTVEDVEDLDENVIEETEIDFTVKDVELPKLLDIVFTGPQTAKLIFSEPVNPAVEGEVSIDDGVYSATVDTFDGNEVEVDIGTELDEGEHEFKVKGFEDYVPYKMITKTVDVEYVDIDEAPVITVKEASQTKVTLEFNRPVKGLEIPTFYHTYSSWKPLSILSDGAAVEADEFYDEVTLYFTGADEDDNLPLPEGKVKIVILSESTNEEIEDRWGNNLDDDVELLVNISSDSTPPSIKKISVEDEQEVRFYLSEDSKLGKVDADEIEIIDEDGDEVKTYDYTRKVAQDGDDYYLEIMFDENQEGTFEITIYGGIYDLSLSENEIEEVTLSFDMEDTTGIDLDDVTATYVDAETLYVDYGTAMATSGAYSVLDWNNYQLVGADLDKDDVKLTMFTSKIVKIVFDDDQDFAINNVLRIARVEDAKGNLAEDLYAAVNILAESGPEITAIKKVAENKFELTIDEEIKSVNRNGIKLDLGDGTAVTVASISFVNDDDDTIIKVTTNGTSGPDGNGKHAGTDFVSAGFEIVVTNGFIKSMTGAFMADDTYTDADVDFEDGMAPELVDASDDDYDYEVNAFVPAGSTTVNAIIIEYTEAIDVNSVSKYTFRVGGYTVKSVTFSDGDAVNSVITLEVENDDEDDEDDRYDELTLIQVYEIEDTSGNAYLEEDAIDIIPFLPEP